MNLRFFSVLLCLFNFFLAPLYAEAAHGVSIDGVLKYPAGFKNFEYVSPIIALLIPT